MAAAADARDAGGAADGSRGGAEVEGQRSVCLRGAVRFRRGRSLLLADGRGCLHYASGLP